MWKTSPPRPSETPAAWFRKGGIHSEGLKYKRKVTHFIRLFGILDKKIVHLLYVHSNGYVNAAGFCLVSGRKLMLFR